jgi:hypothetical protein
MPNIILLVVCLLLPIVAAGMFLSLSVGYRSWSGDDQKGEKND